ATLGRHAVDITKACRVSQVLRFEQPGTPLSQPTGSDTRGDAARTPLAAASLPSHSAAGGIFMSISGTTRPTRPTTEEEYVTLQRAMAETGRAAYSLMNAAICGRVRTLVRGGMTPRYHLDDCRALLNGR